MSGSLLIFLGRATHGLAGVGHGDDALNEAPNQHDDAKPDGNQASNAKLDVDSEVIDKHNLNCDFDADDYNFLNSRHR